MKKTKSQNWNQNQISTRFRIIFASFYNLSIAFCFCFILLLFDCFNENKPKLIFDCTLLVIMVSSHKQIYSSLIISFKMYDNNCFKLLWKLVRYLTFGAWTQAACFFNLTNSFIVIKHHQPRVFKKLIFVYEAR